MHLVQKPTVAVNPIFHFIQLYLFFLFYNLFASCFSLKFQERWMCPNHVEQFIDSKLVTSTRLSERLALWQKYAREPINVDSVRIEFLRKARSGKLFQRGKTLKAQRPENLRIKVPDFIKNAYKNKATGFPIHSSSNENPTIEAGKFKQKELNEDQEEWLKSLVALQSSLAGM